MILIAIILILILILVKYKDRSTFGTIQEIKNNHQNKKCYYDNRQYPVGKVPGSNIMLTDAEKVELNRKFKK